LGGGDVKNTIWSKILFFAAIPLMLLYITGSIFVIRFIFNSKVSDVETETKNLALFNEVSFQRYIDMVKLAVITSAEELEDIDPELPDARKLGEQVLFSQFKNSMVINSWLIFEPNAFDGRDAEHRGEYPGETSGRYMRSYVRRGEGYIEAPDMDETLLDDMTLSYWYLVPKLREALFLDVAVDYATFWDYGVGEGDTNSLSLVAPMFRNGEFIGCVGQDILLSAEILGPEMIPGAVSAMFTPNGVLRFHVSTGEMGKSLADLGFTGAARIEEALNRGEALFLSGEYCPLLQTTAFACFQPVRLADFDELVYVYAAVPESKVRDAMTPVIKAVLYSIGISLLVIALFLVYFFRHVSKPIHSLILACDAISRGKFDTPIVRFNTKDEIGFMTRSLYRMVEQFRVHITMRERSQKLLDMYTRLHRALYRWGRMEDVFGEVMPIVSDFFAVHRASLVLVTGETARVLSFFERGKGVRKADNEDFLYHRQVTALVSGKKYISLNANALREQKISFAGDQVLFLCILPFMAAGELRGYIIMEGNDETGPVIHNDTALLFLSETISFMLTQREIINMRVPASPAATVEPVTVEPVTAEPAEDKPVAEELPVIKAARTVEGLDVDKGLFHSGGAGEQYGELLRISARSFAAKAQTMRSLYTNDLPAFGIEVHGIKGALNAIGAVALGERARELEFAAKAGDAAYCAREYPVFEEKLDAFTAQLKAIAPKKEIPLKGPGSIPLLVTGLEKALEAVHIFDSTGAGEHIASLRAYSWEGCAVEEKEEKEETPPQAGETLEMIADALEYMDYDGAEEGIHLLLEYFKPGKTPGSGNGIL
jgi:HPt (histidine-containing phosphotransfer) domain-containing protein